MVAKSVSQSEKSRSLDVMTFKMGQPALIEASAGTGKTYTITNLVLRALLGVGKAGSTLERPLSLDEMLIVTFTNAATADLRKRIYNRIREARIYLEHFLDFALAQMHASFITTDAEAELWKSRSGRANAQALILRKRRQLQLGYESAPEEAPDDAPRGKSKAKSKKQAASAAAEAEVEAELYQSHSFTDEELDQLFVEFRLDKLLSQAQEANLLSSDQVLAEMLSELLQRASVLSASALVRGDSKITVDGAGAGAAPSVAEGTSGADGEGADGETSDAGVRASNSTSLLRRAIQVLVRAEREINNAAICTIHSFCNSALTQIYALESGEAFNNELKIDLQNEIHESCYAVWRRLFYKKNSSMKLLSDLMHAGGSWGGRNVAVTDPLSLYQRIRTLDAVRLSDKRCGFFGYQLLGMDELLKTCHLELDKTQPLEPQLVDYIASVDLFLQELYGKLVASARDFKARAPLSQFAEFYDFAGECFTSKLLSVNPKLEASRDGRDYLKKIASFYDLLDKEAFAESALVAQRAELSAQSAGDSVDAAAGEALEKAEERHQELLLALFSSAQELISGKGQSLRDKRKGGKAAEEHMAPLTSLVTGLTECLEAVIGSNASFLNQVKYLLRTLVSIAINDEIERTCKDLHVMSTDEVLRRLDYALNARGELGRRLAWSIRARYPLAMIDEFQDTDPVQFSIFSSIYLNPEALEQHAFCYLIGDPKQSIYAFRGSDINSYLKAKNLVLELTRNHGLYTLDTNYRSASDIVYATNALFAPWFNPSNVNPFDEANIAFSPVFSKLEKALRTKGLSKTKKQALWSRATSATPDFIFSEAQELKAQSAADSSAVMQASAATKPKVAPSFRALSDTEAAAAGGDAAASGADTEFEDAFFAGAIGNNSYIVNVGEGQNKTSLQERYAYALAQLVLRLLHSGTIRDKNGELRRVRSGDIAILVRSATENALVQEKLWQLQIPSVYYSDQTSVLADSEGAPSPECIELSYLMEAMCDCTNRNKIARLLGSRMLNLSTEEFLRLSSDEYFEKEVKILSQCAQTWRNFGFLPAFLQWGNDKLHEQSKRLLELKDGERLYTNYCHISEIVQTVHQQKNGIVAQMHWFYELIYQNQGLFDQDVTKKRLESEQEQIKILTVHKSKGLEFPIVFMPFLWSTASVSDGKDEYYGVAKYYDSVHSQHTVLDFNPEHEVEVTRLELKDGYSGQKGVVPILFDELTSLKGESKTLTELTGQSANPFLAAAADDADASADEAADGAADGAGEVLGPRYLQPYKEKITAQEQSVLEEVREQMRLLYVAVTRAKYANFFFVGTASRAKGSPTALAKMHGVGEKGLDPSAFIASAQSLPQLFTVLNGELLLPESIRDPESVQEYPSLAISPEDAASLLAHDAEMRSLESLAPHPAAVEAAGAGAAAALAAADGAAHVPPYAISFLYKDAVDKTFNIFSYSSLVEGGSHNKIATGTVRSGYNSEAEDKAQNRLHDGANDSIYSSLVVGSKGHGSAEASGAAEGAALGRGCNFSIGDERYSVSALMQHYWESNYFFINGRSQQRLGSVSLEFPRGTTPGTFMHAILQNVDFEEVKASGWYHYLVSSVMEVIGATNDYARMANALSVRLHSTQLEQDATLKQRLGEWFNDVLEAPIVRGKYHCLALSDLEPVSYEREMEFLMANERFNTQEIDKICKQVARKLLPPKAQKAILPTLTLEGRSLVGYCKGSIDLACRFNLNQRLTLRERPDLMAQIPAATREQLEANLATLQERVLAAADAADAAAAGAAGATGEGSAGSLELKLLQDAELNPELGTDEPDVKYYVLDYKSNYLGDSFKAYERDSLLASIYTHRYDVQFLIYTLALYRFLKRRMGVPFNASKQDLKAFYDKHVGGVIYLYLRGLQANYLRDQISTGVFSTKIDFAVIYKLDRIFSGEH